MHQRSTSVWRSVILGSAVLLGVSVTQLLADVAATQSNTDQLINQLGSDNFEERDAAQKQLVDAGQPALPALKKAVESSTDPEIRSRAAAALAELKEHADNDVSLITVNMQDAPTQDVLNAISSQAHSRITSSTAGVGAVGDKRTITVVADKKPLWEVMSDVCGQLNVCALPTYTAGKGELDLMSLKHNWMHAPHEIVGPFWIGASSVFRTRTIDLISASNVDDQFTVRLLIVSEPKLAVAQISELTLKEANDDLGNSLIPAARPDRWPDAVSGSVRADHTIETRLSYPDHPGTKIAVLRGELQVRVSGDVQQYIVDDVMGTQKVTSPLKNCTAQATCTEQRDALGKYLVTLQAIREGLNDDEWAALVNQMDQITLVDADGHPLNSRNHLINAGNTQSTFKAIYFSNPVNGGAGGVVGGAPLGTTSGVPKKLTWNVATSLRTVKVPVELKDLPMP
jgi:hypothetical protein